MEIRPLGAPVYGNDYAKDLSATPLVHVRTLDIILIVSETRGHRPKERSYVGAYETEQNMVTQRKRELLVVALLN